MQYLVYKRNKTAGSRFCLLKANALRFCLLGVWHKHINSIFAMKILIYGIPGFKHNLQCGCWRHF